MTNVQKLQIALSQSRKALAEHLAVPEETRSEDYSSKLDTLTRDVSSKDAELTAAQLVEQEPEQRTDTAEDRELRSMIDRANVGSIFEAALERRAIDGVEAELQKHFGLNMNQVPLALLETRAVTPAPSEVGRASRQSSPWIP